MEDGRDLDERDPTQCASHSRETLVCNSPGKLASDRLSARRDRPAGNTTWRVHPGSNDPPPRYWPALQEAVNGVGDQSEQIDTTAVKPFVAFRRTRSNLRCPKSQIVADTRGRSKKLTPGHNPKPCHESTGDLQRPLLRGLNSTNVRK